MVIILFIYIILFTFSYQDKLQQAGEGVADHLSTSQKRKNQVNALPNAQQANFSTSSAHCLPNV